MSSWLEWTPLDKEEKPTPSRASAVTEPVESGPIPETHSAKPAKPAKPLEPLGADLTPERFWERFERERVRLFQENAAALGVTPEEAERLAREQTLLFFEDIKHGRRITNRDYTLTADKSRWKGRA